MARTFTPRADSLGAPEFAISMGTRSTWVVGGMALGIASVELVSTAAAAGHLAFYGAAGVTLEQLDADLERLAPGNRSGLPVGINLAHHLDPERDAAVVDRVIAGGFDRLEASAFIRPTAAILRYRHAGRGAGQPRRLIAKCSHPQVARRWLQPAPESLLLAMHARGELSRVELARARRTPPADALTVEANSGGHTDGRPLLTTLPVIRELARASEAEHGVRVFVGAAGGLGTPAAIAAAATLGADYFVGGSIHQACVESGVSEGVRELLARIRIDEFASIMAVDRLESGARVQVVRNRFARDAGRVEAILRRTPDLYCAPRRERVWLEQQVFGRSLDAAWTAHAARQHSDSEDGVQRSRAIVRAWLGAAARGALEPGFPPARAQIWSGPALGAFNAWASGSSLERPEQRQLVPVIEALLAGARAHRLPHLDREAS